MLQWMQQSSEVFFLPSFWCHSVNSVICWPVHPYPFYYEATSCAWWINLPVHCCKHHKHVMLYKKYTSINVICQLPLDSIFTSSAFASLLMTSPTIVEEQCIVCACRWSAVPQYFKVWIESPVWNLVFILVYFHKSHIFPAWNIVVFRGLWRLTEKNEK